MMGTCSYTSCYRYYCSYDDYWSLLSFFLFNASQAHVVAPQPVPRKFLGAVASASSAECWKRDRAWARPPHLTGTLQGQSHVGLGWVFQHAKQWIKHHKRGGWCSDMFRFCSNPSNCPWRTAGFVATAKSWTSAWELSLHQSDVTLAVRIMWPIGSPWSPGQSLVAIGGRPRVWVMACKNTVWTCKSMPLQT